MLPAQPPNPRRISGTKKKLLFQDVELFGQDVVRKGHGNTMIESKAMGTTDERGHSGFWMVRDRRPTRE